MASFDLPDGCCSVDGAASDLGEATKLKRGADGTPKGGRLGAVALLALFIASYHQGAANGNVQSLRVAEFRAVVNVKSS